MSTDDKPVTGLAYVQQRLAEVGAERPRTQVQSITVDAATVERAIALQREIEALGGRITQPTHDDVIIEAPAESVAAIRALLAPPAPASAVAPRITRGRFSRLTTLGLTTATLSAGLGPIDFDEPPTYREPPTPPPPPPPPPKVGAPGSNPARVAKREARKQRRAQQQRRGRR